jgi:carboxypeptidase family protein
VVDHPYFAVTGPDGRFEIPPLAPGRYTIEVRHERYRAVTREVEVGTGRDAFVHVSLEEKVER